MGLQGRSKAFISTRSSNPDDDIDNLGASRGLDIDDDDFLAEKPELQLQGVDPRKGWNFRGVHRVRAWCHMWKDTDFLESYDSFGKIVIALIVICQILRYQFFIANMLFFINIVDWWYYWSIILLWGFRYQLITLVKQKYFNMTSCLVKRFIRKFQSYPEYLLYIWPHIHIHRILYLKKRTL